MRVCVSRSDGAAGCTEAGSQGWLTWSSVGCVDWQATPAILRGFPRAAINSQLRTGTDKGNPTV